jgi:tetratricopeptide (TPR) repeat protein
MSPRTDARSHPSTDPGEPGSTGDPGSPAAPQPAPGTRAPSGLRRRIRYVLVAAGLAGALTAGALVVGPHGGGSGPEVVSAPAGAASGLLADGSLDAAVSALQAQLRAQPADFSSWATLGLAYVEQARTSGDPTRYTQAQQVLERSVRIRPGNDLALAGLAALAAARHDFAGALREADAALAVNPYSQRALCSRIDALVELGRYGEASKAADDADARSPGVPVSTRYAYVRELRGDVADARQVLERTLATATSPGDIAYVAGALGQLAWNQGDYTLALTRYGQALHADATYVPALEGRARALDATGQRDAAISAMQQVVDRYPLPGPLVELGEMYQARNASGDLEQAKEQYALVGTWVALARANGVDVDLDTALAAADHGDRAAALTAARAEWARRHTVHTADALAWALHVNGRDQEALPYAQQATATGYRNAAFRYHLGVIEHATGRTTDARRDLAAALALNPDFSPLAARTARATLAAGA